jgi:3-oxoacyl-[acyl-carrier-protein] synthase II
MGLCTPLGASIDVVWKKLLGGCSGIINIPRDWGGFKDVPSQVVGLVPRGSGEGEFDEGAVVTPSERRTMSMASVYALHSAGEALKDAEWHPQTDIDKMATGVSIGSCMPDINEIISAGNHIANNSYRRITPYFIPKILCNLPAGHVSMRYGLEGPNHCVSTACTTGLHSIGDAASLIARGACDVMVAGGTESSMHPVSFAGFCRMKALSTKFNSSPTKASRPFDADRDGFVMSEGSGVLVLEELQHALERNAPIHAEILGYGLSSDAYHISSPSKDGKGAINCMRRALNDASVDLKSIGHINVHATSTDVGDHAENAAIKSLFGPHSYKLLVSACKSSIGHLLGASGSVEAIFTVLAVRDGIAPPTLNISNLESEFDLNYCADGTIPWSTSDRRIALSNSFGFGGTNATLCIAEYK